MRGATITLTLLALWPAGSLLADAIQSPPTLQHNPFSRPSSEALQYAPSDRERDGVATGIPELQATLVGSVKKLANVGGRILKHGDEVQGYVLVAIHEQYAVFRRNGEDIIVYVKPLAEENE